MATRTSLAVLATLLLSAVYSPADAQWKTDRDVEETFPSSFAAIERLEQRTAWPEDAPTEVVRPPVLASLPDNPHYHAEALVMSILGSATGILGGAYAGAMIEPDCCGDDPGLFGAFVGMSVGSTVLTPLFAHAGNGQRGSLRKGLLFTVGTEVVALALGSTTGRWEPFVFAPFFHWIGAFTVEISTGDVGR